MHTRRTVPALGSLFHVYFWLVQNPTVFNQILFIGLIIPKFAFLLTYLFNKEVFKPLLYT